MKTINNVDLQCLWFDCLDGAADWGLPPHPRIWGSDPTCLSDVFGRCPEPRRLAAVLLAVHLVYPKATPEWASSWLTQAGPELMGADLTTLERVRWRLVSVPVAAGDLGRLHAILIGAGETAPDCSAWNARILAKDSQCAGELARRLVRLHTGQESCFLFLGSTTSHALIEGESLGLPCYLGARAAAEDMPCDFVVATGRLDEDGRVLPVECLNQKLDAVEDGISLFLYPEGCAAPKASGTECVAVTNVREAADVVACFRPGLALKIAHAARTLRSGQGLAREMCSFQSEMAVWIRRNRERIARVLCDDPHLEELIPQLQRWTDSTLRLDMGLGNAVLECLPVECVLDRGNLTASAAWKICALQMGKANHGGDLDLLKVWTDAADTLRPDINQHDECGRMLTLHYVQKLIGEKHNRYAFFDSIDDAAAAEEISELEMAHARHLDRRGPCSNAVLGQYYGMLGQHHGFLGPEFLGQALAFLDKAIGCFCGVEKQERQERDRDRLYQVFALSSAGRVDEAWTGLRDVTDLWRDRAWNVDSMNPYQLHALLRLHVDSGRIMDSGLWRKIHEAWSRGEQGHPSQLISYNLGWLASERALAAEMLNRSVDLCLGPTSGPTIRVMALMPLARLQEIEPDRDRAALVNAAMEPINNGDVSLEHFHPLLDLPDWKAVLSHVSANRAAFFPFSYR